MRTLYRLDVIKTSIGTEIKQYVPDERATKDAALGVKMRDVWDFNRSYFRDCARFLRQSMNITIADAIDAVVDAFEAEEAANG